VIHKIQLYLIFVLEHLRTKVNDRRCIEARSGRIGIKRFNGKNYYIIYTYFKSIISDTLVSTGWGVATSLFKKVITQKVLAISI